MDLSYTAEQERFSHEAREWLSCNVEPAPGGLTIDEEVAWGRRWQGRLARAGWVAIGWPEAYGGRGATPVHVAIFNSEYARSGAPQLINRVGINLAGPTLLAYGTEAQKARWLPKILTAEELWCQLFSEPGAGSDLASLSTRAERVEGGWLLTGQKIWTSYAQFAQWGICLARSDPAAPKHRGISFFVVDMGSDGVEVRPLVQMTGDAEFNEVFLDQVFVPDDCLVGAPGEGWKVATTTLAHERGTSFAFKEEVLHESRLKDLLDLAVANGSFGSPALADDLAQAFVNLLVLRCHNWRTLSRLARSVPPGPESSIVKLSWTEVTQQLSRVALEVGMEPGAGERQWLWSLAASIAGGTSEVQRTIIGERLLGLPRPPVQPPVQPSVQPSG